jgi:hypothetical protein
MSANAALPTRKIGTDDVSAIGFGAMGLSGAYSAIKPDEERFAVRGGQHLGRVGGLNLMLQVLDELHAQGCTFWDTAHRYGDSEALLGKWFVRTRLCVAAAPLTARTGSSGPGSVQTYSLRPSSACRWTRRARWTAGRRSCVNRSKRASSGLVVHLLRAESQAGTNQLR